MIVHKGFIIFCIPELYPYLYPKFIYSFGQCLINEINCIAIFKFSEESIFLAFRILEVETGKNYLLNPHPIKSVLLSKRLSIESCNSGKKSMPVRLRTSLSIVCGFYFTRAFHNVIAVAQILLLLVFMVWANELSLIFRSVKNVISSPY